MGDAIFVVGATGYTGSHAVRLAAERGLPVVAHVRPGARGDSVVFPGAIIDRTPWDPAAMRATLETLQPRAILSLLGTTRAHDKAAPEGDRRGYEAIDYGLTHLLLEAATGVQPSPRFVYLSCAGASASSRNAYLAVRGRIEEELRRSGLPWASARPVFVTGPDRPESRPAERIAGVLSDGVMNGLALVGLGGVRRRYGSLDGAALASALLALALAPAPEGIVERPRLAELAG